MPARDKGISARSFNASLKRLKLSVYASAPVLGFSLRQAQRYSAGEQPVPVTVARLLNMIEAHGIPDDWRKRG